MIIPMKKYSFLIHYKEFHLFLEDLQDLGVLDVVEKELDLDTETSSLVQRSTQLKKALEVLKPRIDDAIKTEPALEADDILKTISMGEETFYQAEQHMGIWPHARIGSFLARRWMLPGVFENTIKNHHGPTGANDADPLADLVRVADTLVNIMEGRPGYRLDTDSLTPSTREPMVAVLKDAETWFPYLKTEMASATDFFSKG